LPVTTSFPIEIRDLKPGDEVDRTEYTIKTTLAKHDIPCLAYSMEEKLRPGRFYPTKAKKLGIPEGPLWGQLQYGKAVEVDGKTVNPEEVTGPPRRGLKVVYAIDTRPVERVRRLAKNADVLFHDGGFEESRKEKADEYFHSTAKEAAEVAKRAGVKKLVLIHISAVSRDDSILLREAKSVFKDTIVPKDLTTLFVNRP
jgi:ribonuclease Z